jgi:hypothetical protein
MSRSPRRKQGGAGQIQTTSGSNSLVWRAPGEMKNILACSGLSGFDVKFQSHYRAPYLNDGEQLNPYPGRTGAPHHLSSACAQAGVSLAWRCPMLTEIDQGGWMSGCWNKGLGCANLSQAQQPRGHRDLNLVTEPSPDATTSKSGQRHR